MDVYVVEILVLVLVLVRASVVIGINVVRYRYCKKWRSLDIVVLFVVVPKIVALSLKL